jgi:hypothetical protein
MFKPIFAEPFPIIEERLALRPDCAYYLKYNIDNVNMLSLCENSSPSAVELLEQLIEERGIGIVNNAGCKYGLSKNTGAVHILENHPELINYATLLQNKNALHLIEKAFDEGKFNNPKLTPLLELLSYNENAVEFLKKHPEIISLKNLMWNNNAVDLLEENINNISENEIHRLSFNENAVNLLEKYPDKINWLNISLNKNALQLFEKYPDQQYSWSNLSLNVGAIPFLEKYPDKINWRNLSCNPEAIHLIEKNYDNVCFESLCMNPAAIHLIEQNIGKKYNYDNFIDGLYLNPNAFHLLFPLDLVKMKEKSKIFFKDLVEYVFNPLRIQQMAERFNLDMEEYLELL